MEIRRQIEEAEADHSKIAEELKASEQDEKELETFIQNKQEELETWRAEEQEFPGNWSSSSGSKYSPAERKLRSRDSGPSDP